MMSLTCLGVERINSDITMELIMTDLPEPVVPATSMCGIFAMSATTGFPAESRPMATSSGPPVAYGRTSPRCTLARRLLGISMPTYDVPRIGAKMRTFSAASVRAMSSSRFLILLTRSPSPISMRNVVTSGPDT